MTTTIWAKWSKSSVAFHTKVGFIVCYAFLYLIRDLKDFKTIFLYKHHSCLIIWSLTEPHVKNHTNCLIKETIICLHHVGDSISLVPFNPLHLLPEPLVEFYSYDGSLTTPPCYESVKWRVIHQTNTISANQVNWSMNFFYALDKFEEIL